MPMTSRHQFNVLHPTDLSRNSLSAFAHALLLATKAHGKFTVLHVEGEEELHWSEMPGVREMLAQWNLISGRDDMEGLVALGLSVNKILATGSDPVASTVEYLDRHPMDIVVLGTHQDTGWKRWTRGQVAEPIARASRVKSLFIPGNSRGIVDMETGKSQLRKVLIPVAKDPDCSAAIDAARDIAKLLGNKAIACTLLHVGGNDEMPIRKYRSDDHLHIMEETVMGDVVEKINERARALDVDLIAMTTKGHDGFLDILRGSRIEQVLRRSKVAVLAVPAS